MTSNQQTLTLNGQDFTIDALVKAGQNPDIQIQIRESNWKKIADCRALCEKWANEETVIYGVNTSCGGLVNYLLPKENDHEFQQNLIRSITTQVGDFFPDEIVRMTMIARANSLCRGYSAIKPENLKIYLLLITQRLPTCIPVIYTTRFRWHVGVL